MCSCIEKILAEVLGRAGVKTGLDADVFYYRKRLQEKKERELGKAVGLSEC